MAIVILGLLCTSVVGAVVGAPTRTYDQRQHGELNIHAQLDNIVVVLIPSSNFNLLELAGKNKYSGDKPDKGAFLQIFQKPHKTNIDRYETIDDVSVTHHSGGIDNDIKNDPTITSQQVILNHDKNKGEKNEEKEDEIVAVVEEMKLETTEKNIDKNSDTTEDNSTAKHTTISGTVQESVLKVSVPEELKHAAEKAEEESWKTNPATTPTNNPPMDLKQPSKPDVNPEKPVKESTEKLDSSDKIESSLPKKEEAENTRNSEETSADSSESEKTTIEDLIRPVAAKDKNPQPSSITKKTIAEESLASHETRKTAESTGVGESSRREKVIRYKAETKWAPELVDLLGPPKPKTRDLEERQRFASLCSPGVWDTELKTCIMPGETRSRNELAQFLQAMRLGIAAPSQ